MPKQPAIPGPLDAMKKVTRCEQFLAKMDTAVPSARQHSLIKPCYPKAGPKLRRWPVPLGATLLRVYFLINRHAISNPMAEEMLHGSEAVSEFDGLKQGDDRTPHETTILSFRHLLERHGLYKALLAEGDAHYLADRGNTPRLGTLAETKKQLWAVLNEEQGRRSGMKKSLFQKWEIAAWVA